MLAPWTQPVIDQLCEEFEESEAEERARLKREHDQLKAKLRR